MDAVADAVADTRAPTKDAEFDAVGDLVATSRVDWFFVDWSFVDLAVDVSSTSELVVCVVEAAFLEVAVAVALADVVFSLSSSSDALVKGRVATAGGTSVLGESFPLVTQTTSSVLARVTI